MITDLPWQAISIIAANSGQADCVSLGIACPRLMPWIAPRLYQCIVLDLGPRSISKYIEFEEITGHGTFACTMVRTSAGLRGCLQALADHPEWASRVKSLKAESNLPLSDYTMKQLLTGAFRNLTSLVQLQWLACPELPTDVLGLLPNKSRLENLNADLALRANQDYPDIQFRNLRKLSVRPFLGSAGLTWLKQMVQASHDLQELALCRYLDAKGQVGSGYTFVGLSDARAAEQDIRLIPDFFQNGGNGKKLGLTKLELMQFLHDNDADILLSCVEMQAIHTLGLAGRDGPRSCCLLEKLHLPSLENLQLDWKTSPSNLVKYLDNLELVSLEITVYTEPLRIMTAVSRQKNLKHLRVSVNCPFSESDFEPLANLKKLAFLAMPFSFQVRTWTVTEKLGNLEHLQLIHRGEKSQQWLGGGNNSTLVSCGLLSMWNDEYAYPLQYAGLIGELMLHKSLRVVQVDGHLHTLKPYPASSSSSFRYSAKYLK